MNFGFSVGVSVGDAKIAVSMDFSLNHTVTTNSYTSVDEIHVWNNYLSS